MNRRRYIDDEAAAEDDEQEIQELESINEQEEPVLHNPAPDDDEEKEDVPATTVVEEGKGFSFSAIQVFLTYPQATTLTRQIIINKIKTKWPVQRWMISREEHQSGGIHFHAYFKFEKKLRLTSAKAFDIKVGDANYHPNIRRCKKNPVGLFEYISKDGDVESEGCSMFPTSHNYLKKKMDLNAWIHDRRNKMKPVQWPVILPDGTVVPRPAQGLGAKKQRHYYLWGPANVGKTYWSMMQFQKQKVYARPSSGHDIPYDGYEGEEVILFDDCDLATDGSRWESELKAMCDVTTFPRKVPGRTRYTNTYLPFNQARTIIVLANYPPPWINDSWFTSRFTTIDLSNQVQFDPVLDQALAEIPLPSQAQSEESGLAASQAESDVSIQLAQPSPERITDFVSATERMRQQQSNANLEQEEESEAERRRRRHNKSRASPQVVYESDDYEYQDDEDNFV